MKKINYIYVLKDPDTLDVRYVGKTNNLITRLSFHLHDKSRTHKANWIRKLLAQDKVPIMQVEEETGENWAEREMFYIKHYKEQNPQLCNGTLGGDGNSSRGAYGVKAISCYTLEGKLINTFSSIAEASRFYSIRASHISSCCKKKLKTAGNKIWRYEGELLDDLKLNDKAKEIQIFSLEGSLLYEFSSITNTAQYFNCKTTAISRTLRGERKKFRNLIFKYKDIV